ncbi:hypothetical protein T265_11257 [Opisthorchis viverrini]|uniref:Uncharacterized protein n=1 Tax=Opisthorchis viverrini TaxID=6198 RepID=A0A074Z3M3_OPIVI|nr:hypothetical protein T265_11257 [Opisthorchis viverrini]KER20122.1 hypothetical protein T265_11257 [Opisthorchis viverrini]
MVFRLSSYQPTVFEQVIPHTHCSLQVAKQTYYHYFPVFMTLFCFRAILTTRKPQSRFILPDAVLAQSRLVRNERDLNRSAGLFPVTEWTAFLYCIRKLSIPRSNSTKVVGKCTIMADFSVRTKFSAGPFGWGGRGAVSRCRHPRPFNHSSRNFASGAKDKLDKEMALMHRANRAPYALNFGKGKPKLQQKTKLTKLERKFIGYKRTRPINEK